jgi:curved DNA-binding protein CbpA
VAGGGGAGGSGGAARELRHLQALGLGPGAGEAEVRAAYKALAVASHPDKQAGAGAEERRRAGERFVAVQQAYEALRAGFGG